MPATLDDVAQYYRNPRTELLHLVPEGVDRLLDVGCGAGVTAQMMKEKGMVKETWGIELMPVPAELAKDRLDHPFGGDALEIMPTLPDASFDLITFNDVLEHIAYPGEALEMTKRLLTPKGRVLASLPNIRYIGAMKRYLKGEWPQEDQGIFDRTHLRFFTAKSIPIFFESNGFVIEKMVGINHAPYRTTFKIMNALALGSLSDAAYLQYAVVARPK